MSIRVITGSLSARSNGLCFQCDRDGHHLHCGISDVALRDLIDFHRFNGGEDEALRVLLPEIERLANAKYDAGRLEKNGWLVIWTFSGTDISVGIGPPRKQLRLGGSRGKRTSASACSPGAATIGPTATR
jgi:hypothetical protein